MGDAASLCPERATAFRRNGNSSAFHFDGSKVNVTIVKIRYNPVVACYVRCTPIDACPEPHLPNTDTRYRLHWQHAALFTPYRAFIREHIIRDRAELSALYYRPTLKKSDGTNPPKKLRNNLLVGVPPPPPPDVAVYLRLGNKIEAGDVVLLARSGYYEHVLGRLRGGAGSTQLVCWIVTQTSTHPLVVSEAEA